MLVQFAINVFDECAVWICSQTVSSWMCVCVLILTWTEFSKTYLIINSSTTAKLIKTITRLVLPFSKCSWVPWWLLDVQKSQEQQIQGSWLAFQIPLKLILKYHCDWTVLQKVLKSFWIRIIWKVYVWNRLSPRSALLDVRGPIQLLETSDNTCFDV